MKKKAKKPVVQLSFSLKGKNANAFMVTGFKERLKDMEKKIRSLQLDLKNLAPEAPLRVEEQIRQEIQIMEALRDDLVETIKGLETKVRA